jgi:hypothetical protein
MLKTISSLLFIFFAAVVTRADVVAIEPLPMSSIMDSWAQHLDKLTFDLKKVGKYPATGYTECAEAKEVTGGYVCFAAEKAAINRALVRASLYSEGGGGVTAGTVVRLDDRVYRAFLLRVEGHDIPSVNLLSFYARLKSMCSLSKNDPNICPDEYEREIFENFILPVAKKRAEFVVITTSLNGGYGYVSTVSHEIMHAQYFLQPMYRAIVDDFWTKDLADADRERVKKLLRGYDSTNEFVMRNEFQAYLLMRGGEDAQLGSLIPKFRAELTGRLTKSGVAPIQVMGTGPALQFEMPVHVPLMM